MTLGDGWKRIILNLWNIFYLPNSSSNLVNLSLLNIANIFYDIECHILYNKTSWKPLAFAQRWKQSFLLHFLNPSVSATNLLKIDNTYQKIKPKIHLTPSNKLALTIWHKRFGHLNFSTLKKHLIQYDIYYIEDESICNSCKSTKAIKHYNCMPQERLKKVYQFIHTDLVGPIIPRFGVKRYFSIFINNYTCITETYTRRQKSKWFKSLKVFYNLVRIYTGLEQPIKRLQLDYSSELQSQKVDR